MENVAGGKSVFCESIHCGGKRFLVAGYCYEFILRILTPPKKAEKVRFGGVLLREK